MVSLPSPDLLEQFCAWADRENSMVAVTLFGSRARTVDNPASADAWSDVDLQVVTTKPERFATPEWTTIFKGHKRWAYVVRPASGGVVKATALFSPGIEVDVVVVPAARLRLARHAVALGLHRRIPALARALSELATVMSGGHRVLKGGGKWQRFYARVVKDLRGARLDDRAVISAAEAFICDYVWVRRKIERGELVAAQRVLHRSLSETNIQLLHELRLRRGLPSFREARRVEKLLSEPELSLVSTTAELGRASLEEAAVHCAGALRKLVGELLGAEVWQWPDELRER